MRIAFAGAVLRRHRRLRAQQGRDGEGGLLERGADHGPSRRRRAGRSCTARSRRRRSPRPTAASSHVTPSRIEAPNWLHDGKSLIFNSGGRIYRIPAAGGEPRGHRHRLRHALQQRPRRLARRHDCWRSATSRRDGGSRSSTRCRSPAGRPSSITPTGPSYWHGWSPDGKTLAFCGERDGEFDIYTIPAEGGAETRLTTAKGLDDGPEYSPDGKFIYFNSDRTGTMQIWRMRPDGSEQEQVTADEFNNWFPHLSPDGRSMVFLSYEKDVTGHPENKDVTLRLMTLGQQEDRRAGPALRRPGDDQRPVLVARRPEDRVRDLPVDCRLTRQDGRTTCAATGW